ncbi:MaoC family dehydratase N-terminal domain-containing protein [Nocardioides sp. QY071]|uniref:MaoC family dehydratase N-terminal domain-containing protein n=1 Tax=Nocardioides sp. QY071 TaxID=3044187 RepID=UPI00249C7979|nr:MaoC family dehydratase N-terminal domain-containing protein [Nocardioides sp. QY071]WGY00394.1 MaoC family dehydratase N-terminal domain-containing protein [Nocardioides sp. QY071]
MTRREAVLATVLPSFTITPERGQLVFFAEVTGDRDPLHVDLQAARAAGLPDLLVPPTFLFSLELKRPEPYRVLEAVGAELSQALHGEQRFTYHRPVHAGEELELAPRIVDYYEKKDGAMRFVVRRTEVRRDGDLVAELENILILRAGRAA